MIFLIGNSTSNYTVCFPIFILEDTRALKFPYSMLQALEFVLTFVSFYYVIKCCYVAIHIKSFHRNLTVLLIILMIQWFEGLLSNILIKPYETGFWPLGGEFWRWKLNFRPRHWPNFLCSFRNKISDCDQIIARKLNFSTNIFYDADMLIVWKIYKFTWAEIPKQNIDKHGRVFYISRPRSKN